MSKVIKDSNGFVPVKIIAGDIERPPIWEDLAQRIERESEESVRQASQDQPTDSRDSGTGADDFSSFDDFSSPETANEPGSDPGQGEIQETQAPPIDIDALTEEYFNKGVQAGIERMESDYGSSIRTLQSACEQLNSVHEIILKNSLEEMHNMVLKIAEKVIRHSVASQENTIIRTVDEAIQLAVKSDEFIIRVNPDDFETISSRSADFITGINGLENIIVKSDPVIEQGGCLVESSNCTVDATVASQLELISSAIKQK